MELCDFFFSRPGRKKVKHTIKGNRFRCLTMSNMRISPQYKWLKMYSIELFFPHNYINTDLLNSNTASVIKIPSILRGNRQNDRSLNHR
jgi:hypothetical protein